MKNIARLLVAVIASTSSFVLAVYLSVLFLGGLPEENLYPLLKVSTAVALFASVLMFLPVYRLVKMKGWSSPYPYVVPGALVPALLVVVMRPFGSDQLRWIPLEAGLVAIFGGLAALAFWITAPRRKSA